MQISEDRWRKMKTEYITTDKSYNKIAEENGIRYETVRLQGKKENWKELRKKHRAKTVEKAVEKIERQKVALMEDLRTSAEGLLKRANKLMEDENITPQALRCLAAVLRDVKDLLDIKSDADLREQEARIKKLERDAMSDADKPPARIIIEGLPEGYGV